MIRHGRKCIVNRDFFLKESEIRDYFIGLMCTDGSIGSSDYTIQIGLQIEDKDILEKISKLTNIPVYERKVTNYNYNSAYYRFRDKEIHNYFNEIGITSKKTHNLKLNIPLNNHILRGIFDGDGCVHINSYNNLIISIVSASKDFIIQIKDCIESKNIIISSITFHNNVYSLNIYRKKEALKFYNFIYANATLYMNRKYLKFNAVYNRNIINNNTLNSGNQRWES